MLQARAFLALCAWEAFQLTIDTAMKKYQICRKTFSQIRRQTDDPRTVNETLWDTVTGNGGEKSNDKDESDAKIWKNRKNDISGY